MNMGKEYYIYVFLDQRISGIWKFDGLIFNHKPFYIGKGKNQRINSHFYSKQLIKNTLKNNIIKKIQTDLGELPIHYRIFENLTEEEAFDIEKRFINYFGKIKDGGILVNLTNGGDGHSVYHEPKKSHWKEIYQYDLNGNFIKKWESISQLKNTFKSIGNISTAIRRNGTCYGYLWSYKYELKLTPKIKYQMPIKYENIKQIDIISGDIIKVFDDVLTIEKSLSLRNGARNKIYDCLKNKIKSAYGFKWEI